MGEVIAEPRPEPRVARQRVQAADVDLRDRAHAMDKAAGLAVDTPDKGSVTVRTPERHRTSERAHRISGHSLISSPFGAAAGRSPRDILESLARGDVEAHRGSWSAAFTRVDSRHRMTMRESGSSLAACHGLATGTNEAQASLGPVRGRLGGVPNPPPVTTPKYSATVELGSTAAK